MLLNKMLSKSTSKLFFQIYVRIGANVWSLVKQIVCLWKLENTYWLSLMSLRFYEIFASSIRLSVQYNFILRKLINCNKQAQDFFWNKAMKKRNKKTSKEKLINLNLIQSQQQQGQHGLQTIPTKNS